MTYETFLKFKELDSINSWCYYLCTVSVSYTGLSLSFAARENRTAITETMLNAKSQK